MGSSPLPDPIRPRPSSQREAGSTSPDSAPDGTGGRIGAGATSAELIEVVYEHLRALAASRLAREAPGQTIQPTALVHEVYLRLSKGAVGGAAEGVVVGAVDHAGAAAAGTTNLAEGSPAASLRWNDHNHFIAAAALAMRRILVERARAKQTVKRGGGGRGAAERESHNTVGVGGAGGVGGVGVGVRNVHLELDEFERTGSLGVDTLDWIAIDEALAALQDHDPDLAQVVQLRCFAGLSVAETAAMRGVSERTINRDWQVARMWMQRWLGEHAREHDAGKEGA